MFLKRNCQTEIKLITKLSMKLKIISVISVLSVVIFFSSCKKKETNQSFADKVVGNYLVKDTLSSSGCDGSAIGDVDFYSYGIVVTEKNDNTVTISSFNHCSGSFDALVTATSIVALESEPCTTIGNVVGTISGDVIRFNYNYYTICEFNSRATATKQQ